MAEQDPLGAIARLGWITARTPILSLPEVAAQRGLAWLGIKRDDAIEALHGGTKPRKLDTLLAAEPLRSAPRWISSGGLSSGHLVALAAAAELLGKKLEAHCFYTPLSEHGRDNLAFVATRAERIVYHRSRASMVLTAPRVILGGDAVIDPGATSNLAMVGVVRAGLELGQQIKDGELPSPDQVWVALGSGGTAVGLAVGLGMAGVNATVHAVATVERALSPKLRIRFLVRRLIAHLRDQGIDPGSPRPIRIDRSEIGSGYALATERSISAAKDLLAHQVGGESVYTGKAWAALAKSKSEAGAQRRVLFWDTARRGPLPIDPNWRTQLPRRLAAQLERAIEEGHGPANLRRSRRRLVLAGGALALTAGALLRTRGYPIVPGLEVLASWEAAVLLAAAEAVLPPAPMLPIAELGRLAAQVDRFIGTLDRPLVDEIHGMFALIEHGTLLGLRWHRFTDLDPEGRRAFLAALEARGGLLRIAARGIRDLVFFAYYQSPESWAALGYGGPWVLTPDQVPRTSYDALVAPPGAQPKAAR